jgi:transcriptional regulator with XRE-family HTH domain
MATLKSAERAGSQSICYQVGRGIAYLRNKRGWSQRMLADHAGIEKAHLGRLELGEKEAGLLILQKISDALDIPVWELLKR